MRKSGVNPAWFVIALIISFLPLALQTALAQEEVPPGISKQGRTPGEGSHKGWEQGKHKGWEKQETKKEEIKEKKEEGKAEKEETGDKKKELKKKKESKETKEKKESKETKEKKEKEKAGRDTQGHGKDSMGGAGRGRGGK